ncbi:hypothetical protein C7445_10374 [Alicyclobacillus sacchari]|uniref:Uncharacterized protein n=1 Tax=Alicyclobacillus sacchari TaxID=392010 RepID=A0A4V3HER5_9BACL|nr:hypothetical protein [Alicyclobacillus sacchari]TDY50031.1 hypothetical protein C7445_10374 [Alicyclobacillus sacchari]GMA57639.1 hypothetical protein GCM10025858_21420 [Alicyclobacillus sacchari]
MQHVDRETHDHHGSHGRHHKPGRAPHDHPKHGIGPQTFRRGRALAFLETLNVRRATLIRQLEQPELTSIHPVIAGELKAVDMMRDEFMAMFDLRDTQEDTDNYEAPQTKHTTPPNTEQPIEPSDQTESDA